MKTALTGLLIAAAMLCCVPLAAGEIEAPQPHWTAANAAENAAATGTATVNWERVAADSQQAAEQQSHTPAAGVQQPATAPQQPAASAAPQKSQAQTAEEQLKEQEKQRVLGVVPSFNVSYRSDAASLSGKQKISLALHTTFDWATIAGAFGIAGYHEAANDVSGFPWGPKGYFERTGAAYLDTFDGTLIGNGILPAVLHQDPRYFRLGHGSVSHRMLYATAAAFICKHDNTGKWEPNYSNVLGNIASGAISNLYYPGSNSGFGLTISNGMIQTAEGAVGAIFQEFWPDISRKWLHKDPTHGLDAQNNAADKARKAGQAQP